MNHQKMRSSLALPLETKALLDKIKVSAEADIGLKLTYVQLIQLLANHYIVTTAHKGDRK